VLKFCKGGFLLPKNVLSKRNFTNLFGQYIFSIKLTSNAKFHVFICNTLVSARWWDDFLEWPFIKRGNLYIFFFSKPLKYVDYPFAFSSFYPSRLSVSYKTVFFFLSSYTWGHIYSFYHTLNSFFPIAPNERTHKRCYIFTRRMKLYGAKLFSQMVLIFKELLVPDKY